MQSATTMLAIIRDRGKRGLPLERVYRYLFNRDLYLMAYGNISNHKKVLISSNLPEMVAGGLQVEIDRIIKILRDEKYRWTPVKYLSCESKGYITKHLHHTFVWSDALLLAAIQLILESYFEPQWSHLLHSFRPGRGCHTALEEVDSWLGTTWFIEGGMKGCFNRLDHDFLLHIVMANIHDGRFKRLLKNCLMAGYLEDWQYNRTLSGIPQGGIIAPVLTNIYLNEFDTYIEQVLIPDFRYLHYVRYADDWLFGFTGPRSNAVEIRQHIVCFLQERLKLACSEEQFPIIHARTEAARFLGYEISIQKCHIASDSSKQRQRDNEIKLSVPKDILKKQCQQYMKYGKPVEIQEYENDTVFNIINKYQRNYRTFVEYYLLADDIYKINRLRWIMEQSLTRTLSKKLKISVSQVYQRFQKTWMVDGKLYKGLQAIVPRTGKTPLIALWGGIPLRKKAGTIVSM